MRQRFRRITDARPSAPPPTSKLTDERAAHAEAISAPVMNGKLRPWWGVAGAAADQALSRGDAYMSDTL